MMTLLIMSAGRWTFEDSEDPDEPVFGYIYSIEDEKDVGSCIQYKCIKHRLGREKLYMSLKEFQGYLDSGDVKFIGKGEPGKARARVLFREALG